MKANPFADRKISKVKVSPQIKASTGPLFEVLLLTNGASLGKHERLTHLYIYLLKVKCQCKVYLQKHGLKVMLYANIPT